MEPLVGIILINYNNYNDTIECLDSINDSYYKNKIVIVVDNKSKNDSIKKIEDFIKKIKIKVILIKNDENLGFSVANNIGIKHCIDIGCKYVLILNNDTIVDKNFLNPLVKYYEKDNSNNIGALSGKIYFYNKPEYFWYAGGKKYCPFIPLKHIGMGQNDKGQFDKIRKLPWITGCYLFIKTKVFLKIGMLNEDFFFGMEDLEFSMRLRKEGYNLYFIPSSKIWHKVGKTRSFKPSHLFNGYASAVLLNKCIYSNFIFRIIYLLNSIIYILTSYIRYIKKKNIKIGYFKFLNLILVSRKFGYLKNKITEKDLNFIDKKYL